MKFYTKQHKYYCGIDLHARSLYVCILDSDGQVVYHKNTKAEPDALERAISPFLDNCWLSIYNQKYPARIFRIN